MEKVLFIAFTESDGTLAKPALEVLSAAKSLADGLGAELACGLVGSDVQAAADSIAGCGAAAFYGVSGDAFAVSRYGTDANAVEALCKTAGADIVVGDDSSRASRVMPGAAQRLGGKIDTHLTGLEVRDGKPVAVRWHYRQRMFAETTREGRPWVATVSAGCFPPFDGAGSAEVTAVSAGAASRTAVKEILAPSAAEQTIRPEADILFVAGAGWTKKQGDGQTRVKDAEELILDFINTAHASLGGSKSVVDMGGEGRDVLTCLSHLHQVGQTGATPRHGKGLATCCHGEEPHVVGWRFITERRAVNTDASCGWAQGKADVLYVADAFEVMRKVNELLG